MKHDPNIARPVRDARPGEMSDEACDARMAAIPPMPVDDELEALYDAEAEADVAAGRVYPHAIVAEWLRTAGTPGWKHFEEWLADRNG